MRGLLWSHLLASVCGGLVLAGVLLGFGVIGKQRTVTVPVNYSAAPPTNPGGSTQTSDTAQVYAHDNPAVVYVSAAIQQRTTSPFIIGTETRNSTSTGSGFLIAQQGEHGFILTTFHEIQGADPKTGISVQFNSGVVRVASVTRENQANDVALLEVDMKGIPTKVTPLSVGHPENVAVGDSTLTIANPYGLERTLSSSIVSSLQRQLTSSNGTSINDVIQTDSVPSPGASGSPLLNVDGQVIGVNDEIQVSSGGGNYMVGFGVPINTVEKLVVPSGLL